MTTLRPADARGRTQLDWLDSRHTFAFGGYHDPAHLGFRALRVLNDDRVAPGAGFGTHGHRDMEIVTYVLEGALEHQDSLSPGPGALLRPGEVQRMTAGRGIRHSEFNPSPTEPAHFLQIWILPERLGLPPSYEQKAFPEAQRRGALRLVASRDGREGAVTIHQDAELRIGLLAPRQRVRQPLRPGRYAWVHVARGRVALNGQTLRAGDGAAVEGEPALELVGLEDDAAAESEVLLFDLA